MSQRKAANRWRPDAEAQRCSKCQTKFHLFCRRHHCRQCGDIFCHDCSSKKRVVQIVHPLDPHRVCDKCWQVTRTSAGLGSLPVVMSAGPRAASNLSVTSNPYLSSSEAGLARTSSAGGTTRALTVLNATGVGVTPSSESRHGSSSRQGSGAGTPAGQGQGLVLSSGNATVSSVVMPPSQPYSRGTSPGATGGPEGSILLMATPPSNDGEYPLQPSMLQQPPLPSYLNHSQRSTHTDGAAMSNNTSFLLNNSIGLPVGMEPGMCIIPPDDMCSTSEDDEEDDYGDNMTGTPPSMRPTLISSKSGQCLADSSTSPSCNNSAQGGALSFMAALEDATRVRQMSLPVLLYVMKGHELPIVVNVDSADEVVDDIIERLTPRYYELKFGMRRRPRGDDLENLTRTLQFVNESGMTIPKDILLSDLCRRQERVVLATIDTVIHHQKNNGSTRSITAHSGFFMQSERSDEDGTIDDDGAMLE